MRQDPYADLSLAELKTRHRHLSRAIIEGAPDCDAALDKAEALEKIILKRPPQSAAEATIKLMAVRDCLAFGPRADGADLKALDQVTRWLQGSGVMASASVSRMTKGHLSMQSH